jgi:light-regulated signal transduction histidine kinase (bacteriophytochrome)
MVEDLGAQLGGEHLRFIRSIRGNVARMGQLVDDLLSFTRLSRLPLNRRDVDMGLLVRQVLDDLQVERETRAPTLRIAELPATQGDPLLLRQVWNALLANALKFTRDCPQAVIEVGSERRAGEVIYFVRDNGVGFDMRYAGKLFGLFQRLHHPDEFEGTGVGLAIAQRIVHRHGGRIWAEAAVGRGAAFFFTVEAGRQS